MTSYEIWDACSLKMYLEQLHKPKGSNVLKTYYSFIIWKVKLRHKEAVWNFLADKLSCRRTTNTLFQCWLPPWCFHAKASWLGGYKWMLLPFLLQCHIFPNSTSVCLEERKAMQPRKPTFHMKMSSYMLFLLASWMLPPCVNPPSFYWKPS